MNNILFIYTNTDQSFLQNIWCHDPGEDATTEPGTCTAEHVVSVNNDATTRPGSAEHVMSTLTILMLKQNLVLQNTGVP